LTALRVRDRHYSKRGILISAFDRRGQSRERTKGNAAFWFLFLLLLLLSPAFLLAYPGRYLRFERLFPEVSGAPVTGISSMLQDEEGFLWFGTVAGLARYDGRRFVFYSPEPQPGAAGPAREMVVYPVFLDSRGDIWIGTNGRGLFRLEKKEKAFVQYRHDPANPASLSGDTVLAVEEDREGFIWVGTRLDGLGRFDRGTGAFHRVPLASDAGAIWDLLVDRRGFLWIGTQDGGLYRRDPASGEIRNFRFILDDPRSLGSNTVWSIFEDSQGRIWAGTRGGGLNQFIGPEEGFVRFCGDDAHTRDLVSPAITAIAEDGEGRLWIGTAWDGLRVWDRMTGGYSVLKLDSQDADSLADNNITSILKDASGIMWVGTARGGINKCLAGQVKFPHFKHNRYEARSISRNDVRSLWAGESGRLWVGLDEGLDGIDEKTGRARRFRNDPANGGSLSPGAVLAVFEDAKGRVWAGTEGHGLDCLNLRTGQVDHFPADAANPAGLSNNRIYALLPDRVESGVIWVGTHNGLNRFDTRTKRFTRYLPEASDPASLSGGIVTALFESRSGHLWVGTRSGLNRLDKFSGKFERYVGTIAKPPGTGPNDNIINCVHEDREGFLWAGTDNGLNRFDPALGRWDYYTTQNGLPGAAVSGILEDDSGRLWLSTNRGLARFSPREGKFWSFGLHDGLQGDQFNTGAAFKSAGGRMFFGGTNGFNAFRPEEIGPNSFIPPVVWTALYRNGQDVAMEGLGPAGLSLKLSSRSDVHAFEFASLCFIDPPKNKLAYRLVPRDPGWTDLGPAGTVAVSRLRPGNYRLQVKGANPDGVWNETGAEVAFHVVRPYWRTGWFAVLAFLFVAWGAATVVRMWLKLKSSFTVLGDKADRVIEGYGLTAREQEILRLVLQGSSNTDIEKKLFISGSTVRNHVSSIYRKVGVKNRLDLINRIAKDALRKA
jgi:ligand-binding sensor domain-containing protein/DNA-binding CsgD family transcriptional regulator